jgi:hypothetical protein
MSKATDDAYRFSYARKKKEADALAAGGPRAKAAKPAGVAKPAEKEEDGGNRMFAFSTEQFDALMLRMKDGYIPMRNENPWFKNQSGVRKPNIVFKRTFDELREWAKCQMSVHYFAEEYCKIKREDGSIGAMKLRDYQVGIIDLYTKTSRAILMASRQTGKCCAGETDVLARPRGGAPYVTTLAALAARYGLGGDYEVPVWNGDDARKIFRSALVRDGLEVLTMVGWTALEEVNMTRQMQSWELRTASGRVLRSAGEHLVMAEGGWTPVSELRVGQQLLCPYGLDQVVYVRAQGDDLAPMYDLTTASGDYFTAGKTEPAGGGKRPLHVPRRGNSTAASANFLRRAVLSHNTVSAAIVLTQYVSFNQDKGVMIVANKASTVIEIVDKIKSIYKLLPYHLKPGVVNWGQRAIVFDNGCRIKTEARTKEPSIGFTIDFLYLDEFAHIPKNIIEHYYRSVMPTVSSVANSKVVITSTPNGKNLFYKLVEGAEKKKGEPGKNPYTGLRVYWYQVPGRLDTKIYFEQSMLDDAGVSREMVLSSLRSQGFEMYSKEEPNDDEMREAWCIKHDPAHVTVDSVATNLDAMRMLKVCDDVPISALGEVTNWQEQETLLLGGSAEAFNQEYNLRFIASAKMLFDASVDARLTARKREFVEKQLPSAVYDKATIPLDGLLWHPDFDPLLARTRGRHTVVTIDLAEGLGRDFSVLNIWQVELRDEAQLLKEGVREMKDAFRLRQVGIWRANTISVKGFAEAFYLLAFHILDPDRMKSVLEINGPGREFLAQLPQTLAGQNTYGAYVFMRYKHRADAQDRKVGLLVNSNKKMLVKEYAEQVAKDRLVVSEEMSVSEMQNFVKVDTPGGDVTYKAESGHDDITMTVVSAATVFDTPDWGYMSSALYDELPPEQRRVVDDALRLRSYATASNYAAASAAKASQRSGHLPPKTVQPLQHVPFRGGVHRGVR